MADTKVTFTVRIDARGLEKSVQPILTKRLGSITRRIANQARQDVPVKTGNLGRSIVEEPIKFTRPLVAESGVVAGGDKAPYAAAVHEGIAHSYVIVPRRANALRFKIGNRVVFARRVTHPPMKARPFLRNAAERIIQAER